MKKTKKVLLAVMSLVLVAAISVMGTLAYIKTQTGPVTNTFAVGNIQITLDEAPNDYDAAKGLPGYNTVEGDRVTQNQYKLMPGHAKYPKDPTVHVKAGSEKCYVFVKVENGIAEIEKDTTIEAQIIAYGWTKLKDGIYWKTQEAVLAGAKDVDLVVFSTFSIKDDADVDAYKDASIKVTAYAIQFEGPKDAADAWTQGGWE
ncbi:MAG: hypothetical protein IIZ48_06930 [Erysipelotrichales bacterium]|nr:hypothetical protein [Erysipelotrichales bacterium]